METIAPSKFRTTINAEGGVLHELCSSIFFLSFVIIFFRHAILIELDFHLFLEARQYTIARHRYTWCLHLSWARVSRYLNASAGRPLQVETKLNLIGVMRGVLALHFCWFLFVSTFFCHYENCFWIISGRSWRSVVNRFCCCCHA